MKTPLQLFRDGMDTKAISLKLRISEAKVYNAIHRERTTDEQKNEAKALANVRVHASHRRPRRSAAPKLIGYAGMERA